MNVLQGLVERRRLIVCVGSGGVGKTTTAASLGLAGARAGRRVLVLTIDPARRLANSLGLTEFGNAEVRIPLPAEYPGELWAMMLDAPSTFDDVIRRVAKDDGTRDAIYANRIYRAIAGSFSGSQEYMATERLYDVHAGGRYDLIVLDTPPVKNALDFLDAPGRLARFLDRQIMKWFLAPHEDDRVFGKRFLLGTTSMVYRLLGHIFGREFLDDMSAFFILFRDLYDGFRERHEAIHALFGSRDTAFVVIAGPNQPSVEVATFFVEELGSRGLPLEAVIVNQVHACSATTPDVEALLGAHLRELAPAQAPALAARLRAAHRRLREVASFEAEQVQRVREAAGGRVPVRTVPRVRGEVHDLAALAGLHRWLLAP